MRSYLLFTNTSINESKILQFLTVVDVATNNYDVSIHHFLDDIPRRHAELAPLCHQSKDISTIGCVVHILAIDNGIASSPLALVHGNGVENSDCCSAFHEFVNHHQSRGFSHNISIGLEGQTYNGNGFAFETV